MVGERLAYEIQCFITAGKLRGYPRCWYALFCSDFHWKKNLVERDFQQPAQSTEVDSSWSHAPLLRALSPSAATSIRFLPCYLQVKIQACPDSSDNHMHSDMPFYSCGCFSFHSGFLGCVLFIWAEIEGSNLPTSVLERKKSLFNHRHKAGEECRSECCILILQGLFSLSRGVDVFPREQGCPSLSPLESKSSHTH